MFVHIIKANYISEFKIELEFNDSRSGIIDLANDLDGEVFQPLKNKN